MINLGAVLEDIQDWDRALEYNEESSRICIELGDTWLACCATGNLAMLQLHRGEVVAALTSYERSLSMAAQANDKRNMTMSIEGIALCAATLKKWPEAIGFYGTADRIREDSGIARTPDQERELENAFQPYIDLWGLDTFEAQRGSVVALDIKEILSWCLLSKA
jgi:tetratricopeptide (TPR) repeat protein